MSFCAMSYCTEHPDPLAGEVLVAIVALGVLSFAVRAAISEVRQAAISRKNKGEASKSSGHTGSGGSPPGGER